MRDKKTASESTYLSRRKFLAGAGIVLGGVVAGTGGMISACSAGDITKTVTLSTSATRYVCPYDGKTFDTFDALISYIENNFPDSQPLSLFVSPYDGREFKTLEELRAYLDSLYESCGYTVLYVNGIRYRLEIKPEWSLAFVLREKLGLTGTKIGCSQGSCGSCTVIMDGLPVYSCLILGVEAGGKDIVTIEGLSDGINLDPLQQAFVDNDASQCGYCTPGFIMSARALLDRNPSPSRDEVRQALAGHICICGHTKKIIDAVLKGPKKD